MLTTPTRFLDDTLYVLTLTGTDGDPEFLTSAGIGPEGVRKASVELLRFYFEVNAPYVNDSFTASKVETWTATLNVRERELEDCREEGVSGLALGVAMNRVAVAQEMVEDATEYGYYFQWFRKNVLTDEPLGLDDIVTDVQALTLLDDHEDLTPTVFHVILAFLEGLDDYNLGLTTPTVYR